MAVLINENTRVICAPPPFATDEIPKAVVCITEGVFSGMEKK